MKELIEKVEKVRNAMNLNSNQALYIMAAKEEIYSVDLPFEDLMDLSKKGFVKANQITPIANAAVELALSNFKEKKIAKAVINSKLPIMTNDTAVIVKRLAKAFYRGYTADQDRILKYCTSNAAASPYLYIFMEMFPTADKKRNQKWASHFGGENASGVTLRRLTPGTARKFHQIWKKHDIGLFLLGTYLFIKQSENENDGKFYVAKLETYLAEYQHWYDTAEDMLKDGALDEWMTHKRKIQTNTTAL